MRIYRPPRLLFRIFSEIIWKGAPHDNRVYLSFDDGPDGEYTPRILEILNREQVSATFFVLGDKALRHPELVRQIHTQGHGIGIHGYRHERLFYQSEHYLYQQVESSRKIIAALVDQPIIGFRPPFGIFSPRLLKICRHLKLHMVLWSMMLYDFDIRVTDQTILQLVNKNITAGDILALHDGHRHSFRTVRILQPLIQLLKDKGFNLALITE